MKNTRWLSLIVLCTGFLLIVVDMTIVNVALPSIQKDLGFSASGLAWVINAYIIAFGGLLLLAGRVGDLVGRRRVFLAGLALFTAASLLCGLASSQPMLIAARFIQGIGGAVSSAVILAMIVTLFPEPVERAKAFGIFSFVASAGAVVGLIAGGLITQSVSWHWIFFVNLPLGIVTALLAARLLEPDRGIGIRQGADILGAVMVTAALMLGVYTIVQTSDYGLVSVRTAVLGAVTMVLLAAFVVRQARGRNPILPLAMVAVGPTHANYLVHMLVPLALLGLGGGLTFPALTMIAMEDVSPMDAGLASGLLNTTGQVGGAFGLAVLATLAGAYSVDMLRGGADTVQALAAGYHFAWLVSAGVVVATLCVAAWLLRSDQVEPMDATAAEAEAAA